MPTANKLLTELIDNTNSRITVPSGGINYYNNQITVPSNGINFGTSTDGTGTVASGVMDDYEEGTWTPTTYSVYATYSAASGTYVKIGNTVTVHFNVVTSNNGTPGFAGLPFTNSGFMALGTIRENENTGYTWHVRANSNADTVLMRRYDNSGGSSSGDRYIGSITYQTG